MWPFNIGDHLDIFDYIDTDRFQLALFEMSVNVLPISKLYQGLKVTST
jgi:hypothetical protein